MMKSNIFIYRNNYATFTRNLSLLTLVMWDYWRSCKRRDKDDCIKGKTPSLATDTIQNKETLANKVKNWKKP